MKSVIEAGLFFLFESIDFTARNAGPNSKTHEHFAISALLILLRNTPSEYFLTRFRRTHFVSA
jgi:hypothetical protein